jgi:flagellar hook protein FlgE
LSGANKTTAAGAPNAGNIMSGALEQANVDITNELMDMIRAQQVYNGNARMLQTTVETVSRITDKL